MKNKIAQMVTDKVIQQLETAGSNWLKPFIGASMPFNGVTQKRYRGINVFMCMLLGNSTSNQFASYKQWLTVGGQVRKGSKGLPIVFYAPKTGKDKVTGEEFEYRLMRYSTVFARELVDGLPALAPVDRAGAATLEECEQYLINSGADIRTKTGEGAYYRPSDDHICMPPKADFLDNDDGTATEHYYATALHELVHWTGAKHRLNRLEIRSTRGHAFEELIAEMGAAIQCATLGIDAEPRADHAKYLAGWLKDMQEDPRAIFKAAAESQKAVTFIEQLQDLEAKAA